MASDRKSSADVPYRINLSAQLVECADVLPERLVNAHHVFDVFEDRRTYVQSEVCIIVAFGVPALRPVIFAGFLAGLWRG